MYFDEILTKEELQKIYRELAKTNHPDLGGRKNVMQKLNEEYSYLLKNFKTTPSSFRELQRGNHVFVNGSKCTVVEVDEKLFKAKSIRSKREALFDKSTGYGLFNFKIRATLN
ncbi:MAG: hypothetical protein C0594_16860 [Marinilabiliales bacterium]|nr:MAG: hypothetical protein C0594_16860 [Marinilabiliales bacterium]